jgi:hypothetical protein
MISKSHCSDTFLFLSHLRWLCFRRWKKYLPLHFKILSDVEEAEDLQQQQEPSARPTRGWLTREIKEIARLHGISLSHTAKKKAMAELLRTIIASDDENGAECRPCHSSLQATFIAAMTAKARITIAEIKGDAFRPAVYSALRGVHRLFTAVPQYGYSTRYLPMDTRVLYQLLSMTWRRTHAGTVARQEFQHFKAEWWYRIFDLHRLQGIQVPGIPVPPGAPNRTTDRTFNFFLSTDGVGCSVVCSRPKTALPPTYTPQSVPFTFGTTRFKSIDPGLTDIWVGVEPTLEEVDNEDGR